MWKEAKAPDGRTYYWNPETKETKWTKPDDLQSPATPTNPTNQGPPKAQQDSAAVDGAWREATAADGRKYYYNSVTRETKWEAPPAFYQQQQQQQQQQQISAPPRNAQPEFVAGGFGNGGRFGNNGYGASDRRMDRRDTRDAGLPKKPAFDNSRGGGMPWEQRHEGLGFRGPMPMKTDAPEYSTFEQAEDAFFKLLRKHNITPAMEWEDALRLVIQDREFRALKDPRERKQAFEKYCVDVREEEKIKEKERSEKLREDFREMLGTHEDIHHYTRWKTARPIIEREAVFKQTNNDDERRAMFDSYIAELKKKHAADMASQRKTAMHDLEDLLQILIIDPDTKWDRAKKNIMETERFKTDSNFRTLTDLDVLTAFKNHITSLERKLNDEKQLKRKTTFRRYRQARDKFRQILKEHLAKRHITANTKWEDFISLIENDERYINSIGTVGSSPLELFWDVREVEESEVRVKKNYAMDVLDDRRYQLTPQTKYEEFTDVMHQDSRTSKFDDEALRWIFNKLMERVVRRAEEERAAEHRQERKAVEILRSVMKRLDPPLRVSDTYEDAAARLADNEDFNAVSIEGRKSAFDRHIRRLQEREEDYERDRARRERDRDRDRARDTDGRNDSRRGRDGRHRTRTPEVDAYEADRRKAQADRERQYRKPSFGFSPPRERRDERDDKYRRRDTYDSHYDRERREREAERERNYISRADPRDRGRALDYGDETGNSSQPGSVRKRRDSDVSNGSKRDSKRLRRGRTPEPATQDEERELQSGSEEGEIEEV